MDTFMESSWYYARYTCHDNRRADLGCAAPLDRAKADHWLPVDLYIGGIEHAVLHLLYARFFQKALADTGHSTVREPFKRLLCQGLVCMETYSRPGEGGRKSWFYPDEVETVRDAKGAVTGAKLLADGQPVTVGRVEKMSKSKRNTVDPQLLINTYGADTARLFILFAAPPELDVVWNEDSVKGAYRFIKRVWFMVQESLPRLAGVTPFAGHVKDLSGADAAVVRKIHVTIKKATDAMERDFAFNTTIAACMELLNELDPTVNRPDVLAFGLRAVVRLLAPMIPHVTAELWAILTGERAADAIITAGWPTFDATQMDADEVEYPVQINGKMRGKLVLARSLAGPALEQAVRDHADVVRLCEGKQIRKLIVVPGKIVNIVA